MVHTVDHVVVHARIIDLKRIIGELEDWGNGEMEKFIISDVSVRLLQCCESMNIIKYERLKQKQPA